MNGHPIDPVDKGGWTPLIRACSIEGSVQVVSILLKNKANVNASDNEKLNPITIAIINNNLFLAKLLVDNGVNIMKPNEKGKAPYELAVSMEKKVNLFGKCLLEIILDSNLFFYFFSKAYNNLL